MEQKVLFETTRRKVNACGEPVFKQTNWLIASALVGLLRVLRYADYPIEEYAQGKTVKLPQEVWEELPELYAGYLLKTSDLKPYGLLKTFYNNSDLAQIFQKKPLETLEKVAGVNASSEAVERYASEFADKEKFKSLKSKVFEFDPKFVGETFITEVVENLETLKVFEEEIKNASKNKKAEVINRIKQEELIQYLNQKGREENEKILKRVIIEELKKLLEKECEEELPTCRFCFTRHAYKNNGEIKTLEETNFTPIFASSKTLENFFYDGKNALFICPYCEFVLYFSAFGFEKLPSGNYLFVYVPSSVLETLRLNDIVKGRRDLRSSLVEVAKELEKTKSEWLLSNIFFVEIEQVSQNTANVYTFHVPPQVAELFVELDIPAKFPRVLNPIFDLFLDTLFAGRTLYSLLFPLMANYLHLKRAQKVEAKGSSPAERLIKLAKSFKTLPRGLLFLVEFEELLKEGLDMKESVEKQINWAFNEGKKVRDALKSLYTKDRYEKKIETASYRLLEAVRRRDTDAFAQNLIRLYLDVKRPIPKLFADALKEDYFNRIAYAFLIGFNNEHPSEGSEKEETQEVEESAQ